MKKIFVVVDTDASKAAKSFKSESRANDWSDRYTATTGRDSRVDEVWFDEIENENE